jgi:feruloyl esterase
LFFRNGDILCLMAFIRTMVAMAFVSAGMAWGQQSCEKLAALKLPNITITSAVSVPAGPFTVPGGRGNNAIQVPAFCRVAATVEKEVRIELWMPQNWNHKLLAAGNGGLAGTIPLNGLAEPLRQGYATSATDTGHIGPTTEDGEWALGHYDRIVNFVDRGTHLMAEVDKVILNQFYASQLSHSYFRGCSYGGHEAMIEAQRYPNDFDGIIVGDPANNLTNHYIGGHLWYGLATDGDGYLPPEKAKLLGDAVNEQCDALDGVKDGVLTDPRKCKFNPATLLCKGGDPSKCLTEAQVRAVEKIWTGLRTPEGQQIYPGLMPGGEAGGWTTYFTGKGPGTGRHMILTAPFFKYFVFEDANYDPHNFRFAAKDGFDSDIDIVNTKLAAVANAVNPDLSQFRGRGGKMIHYHGWSDPDITPLNSVNYYESVVQAQGKNAHALEETQAFYRLFMVPGMWHCANGPGATSFDMLPALENWVEKGQAPQQVIASKVTNGKTERTRPLCPYPLEAQYKGTGSTDDSANFSCGLPKP